MKEEYWTVSNIKLETCWQKQIRKAMQNSGSQTLSWFSPLSHHIQGSVVPPILATTVVNTHNASDRLYKRWQNISYQIQPFDVLHHLGQHVSSRMTWLDKPSRAWQGSATLLAHDRTRQPFSRMTWLGNPPCTWQGLVTILVHDTDYIHPALLIFFLKIHPVLLILRTQKKSHYIHSVNFSKKINRLHSLCTVNLAIKSKHKKIKLNYPTGNGYLILSTYTQCLNTKINASVSSSRHGY